MIPPVVGVTTVAVSIVGIPWRITLLAIMTPRGHHIVTTTIEATKGILMDPGMSPLVAGLSPMIIVQFPHDNPPYFDVRALRHHA
jgi:hypothetical protein